MRRRSLGAAVLVAGSLVVWPAGPIAQQGKADVALRAAMETETVKGDLKGAIEQYKKVAQSGNRVLAAQALVRMADCYRKLGDAEALKIYEQVIREFADQKEPVAAARTRLAALQSPAVPQTRQAALWTGQGVDGGGSPSPDGRYLSFTDWDTGDLAVRDLTTGTNRRLTNTGGWVGSGDYAAESVISPDGRQVAYTWFVEKEHKNELRVVPLTTGDPTRARVVLRTDRNDYVAPFAWTPDGRQVFVIRSLPDRTNQIGTIAAQDGSFRNLKSLEWRYPDNASLSPDGRYVAYDAPSGDNGSPRDIMLLATDGSREVPLVQNPANDSSPIWSPDGSHVLFLSDRTGTRALWAVPAEEGTPTGAAVLVKANIGSIAPLGVARNGALYYLLSGGDRQNIHVADLDAVKATRTPVLATEGFVNANNGPAWSPDGQYLAYYSFRNSFRNPPVLVIRSDKTGDERTFTVPVGLVAPFFSGPKWFPYNRAVLVLSRDAQGSGFGFHRLSLDTGKTDLVWHINQGTSSFALSPDGKTIFYVFQNTGQQTLASGRLMRFDIESRRETELKKDEWFISLALSPDGTQLAYLKSVRTNATDYPSVVEVMPAAGGASREVYRDAVWLGGSRYNTLAWASDQRFLLFAREVGEGSSPTALWRVPVTGGEPEKVGIAMPGRIKSPAVHPDGKRMVFGTVDKDDNEVWTLENFLPAPSAKK